MVAPANPPPKIPDVWKSGISAAIIVFLTTFAPTALGFFQSIAKWASSSGHTPLPGSPPSYGLTPAPEPSPAPVTPASPAAPANVVSELLAAIAARREAIKTAEAELDALRAALAIPEVAAG